MVLSYSVDPVRKSALRTTGRNRARRSPGLTNSIAEFARPQFRNRARPVFLWRPIRTAPGLPEFVRQGFDFIMPERDHAMSGGGRVAMLVGVPGMLERLS